MLKTNTIHYIPATSPAANGFRPSFAASSNTGSINYVQNNIINAKDHNQRKAAILKFSQNFSFIYKIGENKWQNPKYHQFTITDHMLKAAEEATKIVRGEHPSLDEMLTPTQKLDLLKSFDEKIDGIDKATLFVIAMAFHDMDKLYRTKPRQDINNRIWTIKPSFHKVFNTKQDVNPKSCYWSSEPAPERALKEFKQVADQLQLSPEATKYINNIMICHDNPLTYIIWEIENGRTNVTKLFEEMRQNTPIPLKELGAVFLADQSGKGDTGWLEHLEKVSPWKCIFKSLAMERPLSELDQLLPGKKIS